MVTIAVDIDGVEVSVNDFTPGGDVIVESSNPEYIQRFHLGATLREMVEIVYLAPSVQAGYDSPLAVTAALVGISPGRARIISTTDDVNEFLVKLAGPQGPGIVN